MAKQTGIGDKLQVDDSTGTPRDISNDVTNYSIQTSQGLIDVTGLDKPAMERLLGLADGSFQLTGIFNPAPNMSHAVFSVAPNVVRTVTLDIGGSTQGNPRLSMECMVQNYNQGRGNDGKLEWTVELPLANGAAPAWSTVP